MNDFELQTTLEQLVAPLLEKAGVELVELQVAGSNRRPVLRVYVDRPGGITIGECATLSRAMEDLLDVHDPIEGSYTLEVSSPGLDRPLKSDRDFQRAVGRAVRLIVRGGSTVVGTLVSCEGPDLVVTVREEPVRIPRAEVLKANLHFEF